MHAQKGAPEGDAPFVFCELYETNWVELGFLLVFQFPFFLGRVLALFLLFALTLVLLSLVAHIGLFSRIAFAQSAPT